MKTSRWIHTAIHTAIMTVTLAMAGCGKQSSVDTASLEKSFKSAEAAVQTSADKAVAAIKSADYSGAMAELKRLASNAKLTPEQQQSIKDVMSQVEKAISDAANKTTSDASKAMTEIPKALPK